MERPSSRAHSSTPASCLARQSAASTTQCDEAEAVKSSTYEEVCESVDVDVDDLLRFGARVRLVPGDLAFIVKFLEDLPQAIHKWAVMVPEVYDLPFEDLVSKVPDWLSAHRAADRRGNPFVAVSAAPKRKQRLQCPRSTGPHRVKDCTQTRRRGMGKTSTSKLVCFRCRKAEHLARDCPETVVAATTGGEPHSVTWGKTMVTACQRHLSAGRQINGVGKPLTISEKDFEAAFTDGVWTVS